MPTRMLAYALAVSAILAAVLALGFAADNPTINSTSRGDSYQCLAPWDTVLNNKSNFPGGEPPPDGDSIASRCRAAGQARFDGAMSFGALAVALGVGAAVTSLVMERRRAAIRA